MAAVLPNPLKYKVRGNSPYVEKRAHLIYAIMVKRGIVIPEYEEVSAPSENEQPSDSTRSDVTSLPEEKPADAVIQPKSDQQ